MKQPHPVPQYGKLITRCKAYSRFFSNLKGADVWLSGPVKLPNRKLSACSTPTALWKWYLHARPKKWKSGSATGRFDGFSVQPDHAGANHFSEQAVSGVLHHSSHRNKQRGHGSSKFPEGQRPLPRSAACIFHSPAGSRFGR
jgi:hypothetical protein